MDQKERAVWLIVIGGLVSLACLVNITHVIGLGPSAILGVIIGVGLSLGVVLIIWGFKRWPRP